MANYPTDDALLELGDAVYELAQEIFDNCGATDDICIQHGTVFGGTNRLILTVRGWCPDRSYCTEAFLANFDRLYN